MTMTTVIVRSRPERPPVRGTIEYVVQPGDTMFLIAKRHGVSSGWVSIMANPQIRNPDVIFPGEVTSSHPSQTPYGPAGVNAGRARNGREWRREDMSPRKAKPSRTSPGSSG